MSAYRAQDRTFQAAIAKRTDELRTQRDAQQIAEMVRDLQDELVPWLLVLFGTEENHN